jgi:uncharacterized membrane protein YfcA
MARKIHFILLLVLIGATDAFHVHADTACTQNEDCLENWEICRFDPETSDAITQSGICKHKSIFDSVNGLEIAGFVMTFLIIFFSNAGGLGGGGSMVPIILIFFRFDLKRSIALSNSTIFVSALIRYLVNLPKKHPTKVDL